MFILLKTLSFCRLSSSLSVEQFYFSNIASMAFNVLHSVVVVCLLIFLTSSFSTHFTSSSLLNPFVANQFEL